MLVYWAIFPGFPQCRRGIGRVGRHASCVSDNLSLLHRMPDWPLRSEGKYWCGLKAQIVVSRPFLSAIDPTIFGMVTSRRRKSWASLEESKPD